MAIIYSYPETTQILLTDMLIGTSTIRVAGKKKNLTKNFTIETLGGFIHDNFPTQWGEITGTLSTQTDLQAALDSKQGNITLTTIGTSGTSTLVGDILNIPNYTAAVPTKTSDLINDGEDGIHPFITAEDVPPSASTLNDVLTNGNTSLLDAKVGNLGVWDPANLGYLQIIGGDNNFLFKDSANNSIVYIEQGILGLHKTNSISGNLFTTLLTTSQNYDLPNTSGTIALTSDLTPYLLSTTAVSTYYPIPTGTISQYIRGDGTFATFPGLTGYVPYTGATNNVDLGLFDITASHLIKNGGVSTQFLKADGSVDNNIYLTSADLPSTLDLFATTYASDIPGYSVLVRNITDSRFNTIAVDVSTGVITTTTQLVGSLISDANTISGNPGIFNIITIGNISRTSGTGQAEFFFRVYKRSDLGVETLITESSKTLPVTNGGYTEFSATALWNDGIFLNTDRIVLKYYADRLTSPVGSNPTYKFQFGGISPVRSTAAVPVAVLPNIYLSDLADVEDIPALNNEILYWNNTANLWEHSSVIDLLSPASSTVNGYLSSTDWTTFNAKQNALTNPITGTGTIGTIPKFNGSTTSLANSTIIQLANGDVTINGVRSGKGNNTLSDNTVFGYQSGNAITTGNYNTLIGYLSGTLLTTGSENTFIGRNSGQSATTTSANVAIGQSAGNALSTGAGNNVLVGVGSGFLITSATYNTGVGNASLRLNVTGGQNAAFGNNALYSNTNNYNTGIGYNSGYNTTSGNQNVYLGYESGSNNTTGGGNVALGSSAGRILSTGGNLTIANASIFIGYLTKSLANNQTNEIVIGDSAIGLGSNSVVLGNDSITKTALKGQIAIGTTAPVASAKAQIDSTTQGFLPPRMTNAQRIAISSPAVGLCVYCTDAVEGLYVNKSTGWVMLL